MPKNNNCCIIKKHRVLICGTGDCEQKQTGEIKREQPVDKEKEKGVKNKEKSCKYYLIEKIVFHRTRCIKLYTI